MSDTAQNIRQAWLTFVKRLPGLLKADNAGSQPSADPARQAQVLVVRMQHTDGLAGMKRQVKQAVLNHKWTVAAKGIKELTLGDQKDTPMTKFAFFVISTEDFGELRRNLEQIEGVQSVELSSP